MTERDPALDRLLRPYADATAGTELDTERLRRRILHGARASRRRAPRKLVVLLPLAACFIGSVAFAASSPELREIVQRQVQELFGGAPRSPARPPARKTTSPSRDPLVAPARSASVATSASADSPAPIAIDALPLVAPARAQPSSSSDTPDPALEGYRAAHRVHFGGASPDAALAAWDDYLNEFPASGFASDARFNRALCLVRLGRNAEARRALEPFADAPTGSYRQAEAASLLQGLGAAGFRSSK
jgi:TolA-binding protein